VAETTGQLSFVKVNATPGSDFALFELLDQSTTPPTPEIFFVWFTPADRFVPTGPQWMQRSLQVSLLRDALTAGKTVTVFHDDNSSFVRSLSLNA
jgi:hypothetical protein